MLARSLWLTPLAVLALAGCGGGKGGGTVGGPAPAPDSTRDAAARFDVDLGSGKVTVTPIKGEGRALYTGSTLEFQTSDVVNTGGSPAIRRISAKVRNNSGNTLGAGSGIRLIFSGLDREGTGVAGLREDAIASTLAGNGAAGVGDGSALSASTTPSAVKTRADGTLLILEANRLRTLRNGQVSTIRPGFTNATGFCVVRDPGSGTEFAIVADRGANLLRSVDLQSGAMQTVAGTGTAGDVNGTAATAQFSAPSDVAYEPSSQSLLVADRANSKVKRVTLTFSGGVPTGGSVSTAFGSLTTPTSIDVSPDGDVAVAEETAHRIRLFLNGGAQNVTLGSGSNAAPLGGTANAVPLPSPTAIAYVDGVLVATSGTNPGLVAIFSANGAPANQASSYYVALLSGTGVAGLENGNGFSARYQTTLGGIVKYRDGIAVSDRGNRLVRQIALPGSFATIGDGSPTNAGRVTLTNRTGENYSYWERSNSMIKLPTSLPAGQWTDLGSWDFVVPEGMTRFRFYVAVEADSGASMALAEVVGANSTSPGSPDNMVRVLARTSPLPADGIRGNASLPTVTHLAYGPDGALYIASGSAIRRWDPLTDTITTIAGVDASPATVDGFGAVGRLAGVTTIEVMPDNSRILIGQSNEVIRVLAYFGGDRNSRASYGLVTALGQSGSAATTDGVGTAARVDNVRDIAATGTTEAYVATRSTFVRRLQIVGTDPLNPNSYQLSGSMNTINSSAPTEVVADGVGALAYLTEAANSGVYYVSVRDWTYSIAINGTATDQDGGYGTAYLPSAIALSRDRTLTFISQGSTELRPRVRRASVDSSRTATLAGGGSAYADATGDRAAVTALASRYYGALAPNGDYAFSDGNRLMIVQRIVRGNNL